jgi:hypothetical protein
LQNPPGRRVTAACLTKSTLEYFDAKLEQLDSDTENDEYVKTGYRTTPLTRGYTKSTSTISSSSSTIQYSHISLGQHATRRDVRKIHFIRSFRLYLSPRTHTRPVSLYLAHTTTISTINCLQSCLNRSSTSSIHELLGTPMALSICHRSNVLVKHS